MSLRSSEILAKIFPGTYINEQFLINIYMYAIITKAQIFNLMKQ